MTLHQLTETILLAAAWLAAASRLPAWPASHQSARAWLRRMLVCLASALTISYLAPASGQAELGVLTGVPHLVWMLRCAFMLLAVWAALAWLAHLQRPGLAARRATRHHGLLTAATIVLVMLLAGAASTSEQARTWEEFVVRSGHDPFLATGMAIYLVAVALALLEIVRSCWAYASTLDERPDARIGLRLLAAGALTGIVYAVAAGLLLADQRLPVTIPPTLIVTLRTLAVGGGTLGASVPLLARILADYRTYKRLRVLREAIARTTASIVEALRSRLAVWHLSSRNYEHIADLRAGWLDLRTWMTLEQAATARQHGHADGLDGDALDAYIEAHLLLYASARRADDLPPVGTSRPGAPPGGADRHTETAWLREVAGYVAILTATRHRRGLTTTP